MASFQRAISSVYGLSVINRFIFWSLGSNSLYNAMAVDKPCKNNLSDVRRFAFCHFVLQFIKSTAQKDSSKFATIAIYFVDSLSFSCPLFHLCNTA